jgi:predicted O-linked N-acetylglucosamine transferase (SPINDLY family)
MNSDLPPLANSLQKAMREHQAGKLAEAERGYRWVLAQEPNQIDALHLLGVLRGQLGKNDEALELISRAIEINPQIAGMHDNLGVALAKLGRLDEAIAAHRKAIALQEALFPAYFNLGNALRTKGELAEAIAAYRGALRLKPTDAESHNNLGLALRDRGRMDEAMAEFAQAMALGPGLPQVRVNLGNALMECGQADEAMACFDRAVGLDPKDAARRSGQILAMHYHPRYDAAAILGAARKWDEIHGRPLAGTIKPHGNDRSPRRRLRIGYVSPDFRQHVVGQSLLPLLANRDREQFEVFCYSSAIREDSTSAKIRGESDAWRDIYRTDDEQAAEMIRADGIDILVDLAAHSEGNRLPLFARKPAPVQFTYLGYCSTTGLSAMDARISDPLIDPADSDLSVYSERTILLPRTHLCYQPGGAALEVSPLPALWMGRITFGCLNSFTKASADAMDLWATVLRSAPKSKMIIHAKDGKHLDRVRERFGREGVSADRLEFVSRQPWAQYMQTYGRIDIALDPFPFGGGITTCDALWMGVPVVTLVGATAVGRVGRSILSNVGLPELVAQTPEDYVRIAVDLAKQTGRLSELRAGLRGRLQASPMMDAKGLAKELESAYRREWERWCAG